MCSGVVPQHPPMIGAGPQHATGVLRHILGRSEIDVAALHPRGHARVGHGAQRLRAMGSDFFQRLQDRFGTDATVEAEDIKGPVSNFAGQLPKRSPPRQLPRVVNGHLRDDHHVFTSGASCGQHGFVQFVQIGESLKDQKIGSRPAQCIGLLTKDGPSLGSRNGAQRFDVNPQGTHGARHKGSALGGLLSQAHARAVDRFDLIRQPEGLEPRVIRSIGISL